MQETEQRTSQVKMEQGPPMQETEQDPHTQFANAYLREVPASVATSSKKEPTDMGGIYRSHAFCIYTVAI